MIYNYKVEEFSWGVFLACSTSLLSRRLRGDWFLTGRLIPEAFILLLLDPNLVGRWEPLNPRRLRHLPHAAFRRGASPVVDRVHSVLRIYPDPFLLEREHCDFVWKFIASVYAAKDQKVILSELKEHMVCQRQIALTSNIINFNPSQSIKSQEIEVGIDHLNLVISSTWDYQCIFFRIVNHGLLIPRFRCLSQSVSLDPS